MPLIAVNNVRTVSDTKRAFYSLHTRPITSIYRRVVEELMVEMHLLTVNENFRYDPFYAFGVVSAFSRFMQGYKPEADRDSIFNALCKSMETDPQVYKQDAEMVEKLAHSLPGPEIITKLSHPPTLSDFPALQTALNSIASNSNFKYSRLFAIGLFTMLDVADPELVRDETNYAEALNQISEGLHLPVDKLRKDLDLYRSNLEKMLQAQQAIEDMLAADRKQRERRSEEQSSGQASE